MKFKLITRKYGESKREDEKESSTDKGKVVERRCNFSFFSEIVKSEAADQSSGNIETGEQTVADFHY